MRIIRNREENPSKIAVSFFFVIWLTWVKVSTEWTFHNCLFRDRLKNWCNCCSCEQNKCTKPCPTFTFIFTLTLAFPNSDRIYYILAILLNFSLYLQRVDVELVMHAIGNYMCVRQMLSRHGWFACVYLFQFLLLSEWNHPCSRNHQFFNYVIVFFLSFICWSN